MARRIAENGGIKEERPSFFKVILPGYNTEQLRIPPHFLEHGRNDQPERATLTWNMSLERSWTVKVCRTKEGVYFKDGWRDFLNDNSVKEGDFLVFTYEGDMHFSIRDYENNCCKRGDFPTNNEPHEESAPAKSTKRNPGCPKKDYSAESFRSKFPHYTRSIKKKYCVYSIPTAFYRKHLSAGNYEVAFLKISGGTKWFKVKLVPSLQTAFMSKGWSVFAHDNQIVVGDVCAFELVKENKMVVHILRK
ncbi:B3 domain-containing protein Os01g0723500-like [Rosa rugosa]|uniref:B3 domain-containing protein Os01g0723500-like n=1 Tax=Rosa rugosa TaxID=74645 RepID=UPI002B40606D|nr:B3 domain-containing protein Os01g0723500-like [Rosa rugosa]